MQTVAVYTGDSFFDNLSTDTTGRSQHARGPQFRKEQNEYVCDFASRDDMCIPAKHTYTTCTVGFSQNMETFGQIRLNRSQRLVGLGGRLNLFTSFLS